MPNYFTELKDGPSGPSFKVKDEEAEQAIGSIGTALGNKVDKVAGKGLSTNDYSDTEKGKVADNAEAIEAMVNVMGSKNLLPFDFNTIKSLNVSGTWSGNSYSYHSIVVTLNEDGSITLNGTSDITFNFVLAYLSSDYINKVVGMLFSSGTTMPEGVVLMLYRSGKMVKATPQGAVIDNDIGASREQIYITKDINYSNVTIYPMIRDARITDSTYVPYAMTNRELTEKTLKYIEIPYSSFSWDDTIRAFKYSSPSIDVTAIKGFIVTPLNGQGILGGFYSENQNTIYVMGWIPSEAESIDSNWRFKCFVVY